MMRKQGELKNKLHQELRLRYQEFFESQLAIHLLQHCEYFPSVKKVSKSILDLMSNHKETVINTIKQNKNIIAEMRTPYFGGCFAEKQNISAEVAYEKMVEILEKSSDLSVIMQLHGIFVHRIYDQLENNHDKPQFKCQLFPNSLFSNRVRIENKNVAATNLLGITKNPVFSKMLHTSVDNHIRALDKFLLDADSEYYKSTQNIPRVCGPSGHTGSFLLGTKLYGKLNAEELQEYSLACFAFLTAGGNHSFYEVFIVANLIGVPHEVNSYLASIPDSISTQDSYQLIKSSFPEFLS